MNNNEHTIHYTLPTTTISVFSLQHQEDISKYKKNLKNNKNKQQQKLDTEQ